MKVLWFRALLVLIVLLLPIVFFGNRWGWATPLREVRETLPGTMIFIVATAVIAAFLAGFYFVRGLDSRQ